MGYDCINPDCGDDLDFLNGTEEPVWVCADKHRIPLSEMKTPHIHKCLARLRRGGFSDDWRKIHGGEWEEWFVGELAKRNRK